MVSYFDSSMYQSFYAMFYVVFICLIIWNLINHSLFQKCTLYYIMCGLFYYLFIRNHRHVFNKHSTFIRFWWETRQSSNTVIISQICATFKITPISFSCFLTGITWKWHQSRFSGCHWCNSASLSDTTMWQW